MSSRDPSLPDDLYFDRRTAYSRSLPILMALMESWEQHPDVQVLRTVGPLKTTLRWEGQETSCYKVVIEALLPTARMDLFKD